MFNLKIFIFKLKKKGWSGFQSIPREAGTSSSLNQITSNKLL